MRIREKKHLIIKAIIICGALSFMLSLCSCMSMFGECKHTYSDNFRRTADQHTPICDRCGEEGESAPHRFGELVVTIPATKQEDGEGYYPCLDCGFHKRETLIGCEHELVFVEEKEPTCYSFGMHSHYKCYECGRFFDADNKVEIKRDDLLTIRLSHTFDISTPEVDEPTLSESGVIRYYCNDYENCRGYVSVILPKLSESEYYNQAATESGNVSCSIKESYLDDNFKPSVGDVVREWIIEKVLEMSFEYSSCDTSGHRFVKDGFVNEEGRLFYICQNEPRHRYEITLPAPGSGKYKEKSTVATCTRAAGTEYRMNYTAWRSVLEPHIDDLCGGDVSLLPDFADALAEDGFVIFVSDNGELDLGVHNEASIIIRDFIPPTFDVYTNEKTTGTVYAICSDCEAKVEKTLEYSEGEWEVTGNLLSRKYCRIYEAYGQTVKDEQIARFKYKINLNGGTVADAEVVTEGESSEGFITVSELSFTKEEMAVRGISLAIDGKGLTDSEQAVRVEECQGFSLKHGSYTYWKIYVGGEEFPGHISIKILWKYV